MVEAPADTTWKGYSIAERDRRWGAVREFAAAAGFDAILVPPGDAFNSRYLGDLPNACIILPTAAGEPIGVSDRGRPNRWLKEIRPARAAYSPVIIQALLDAGLERARIGVTGLRGGRLAYVRAPE